MNTLNKLNHWQIKNQAIGAFCFIFFAFCIPVSLALENIGLVVALLPALLSGLWWTYRRDIGTQAWNILLILLTLSFIVGVFYSISETAWALKVLKKEAELIVILFLLPVIINDERYLLRCLKAFVVGCLLVYITAILGNYHQLPAWTIFQHPAPYYSFFKIYAAMFMAFGAFIALNIMVNKNTHRFKRFFWAVCFLLITYNVLWQSLSRTGYIIYFLLLVVFCLIHTRPIIAILGIICTGLLLLGTLHLSANLKTGLHDVKSNYEYAQQGQMGTSGGIRMEYFVNSVQLWKEKPIFGQGTGGYRTADVRIGGINSGGGITTHAAAQVTPENTFYRILVEQGLVGILFIAGLFLLQLYYSFFKLTGLYRKMAIGFMLTMIVGSFSQDLILDESPRLFYVLFTALLYAPVLLKIKKPA